MKKTIQLLTLLVLTTVIALSMVACGSAYGKVEKALVDIGYAVVESDTSADAMEGESDVAVTTHVLTNKDSLGLLEIAKLNVVIVFEFKATDDMKEFYTDSSTMQGLVADIEKDGSAEEFYNALVEKGYAKGNCLVISTNVLQSETVRNAIKAA